MTLLSEESWSILVTVLLVGRSCFVLININLRESEYSQINDWRIVLIIFSVLSSVLYLKALSHKNNNFGKFKYTLSRDGLKLQSAVIGVSEVGYVMCFAGSVGFDQSDYSRLCMNLVGVSTLLMLLLDQTIISLKYDITPTKVYLIKVLVVTEFIIGFISLILLITLYFIGSLLLLIFPLVLISMKIFNSDVSYSKGWMKLELNSPNEIMIAESLLVRSDT